MKNRPGSQPEESAVATTLFAFIRHFFLGTPLKTSAFSKERLNVFWGLPILDVDALSSVAYATEEILIALSVAGTSAFYFSVPIACSITLVMVSLIISYSQTVQAYPQGGGAYVVSKHHLGSLTALIAAASLLIDYILTVAVSVTAGVYALTSAYPVLASYKIECSVGGILVLTWINLRGLRESSRTLALPIYGFIIVMVALGLYGFISTASSTEAIAATDEATSFSLWNLAIIPIVLRAFAGGCTAMTGVEAIANAGSALARPHSVIAQRILFVLGLMLGTMFMSITLTSNNLHLQPNGTESIISQMAHALWGNGSLYWTVQILTCLILFLAANTAFVDYPRLSAMLARDGWFPKQLAALGDRLVFSNGIVVLAILASCLVIVFEGSTHHLIPLYAVGVFTAFTLSQAGMVRYWMEKAQRNKASNGQSRVSRLASPFIFIKRYGRSFVNAWGSIMTGLALLITIETKFFEGAYLVIITVPLSVAFCYWIKRHYLSISHKLAIKKVPGRTRDFSRSAHQAVIVPISRLHRGSYEALAFAREMSTDVTALIVDIGHNLAIETKQEIEALRWHIRVVVLESPYRSVIQPIIEYVHAIDEQKGKLAILVLPEFVPPHWWHRFLHNRTAKVIMDALADNENIPGQARIIINVPFYPTL